jgi:hypothetical protein
MLAPEAEIAAERREACETRQRFGGSVERAVERIALDRRGEEDDEPETDRDPAGEAPRIRAPEAEVVEEVAGSAGDARPPRPMRSVMAPRTPATTRGFIRRGSFQ